MPRFPETSVACLKRVMLARAPEFMFTPADVEAVMLETGLNKAQVQVWADNFRMRYGPEKDRMEFLKSDGFDKTCTSKITRIFVCCFNVTPEFATNFKFAKSKGQGEFSIKYMEAGFNKEAESGEFFLEFDDYIWEHKLVESFQLQGAGQVNTITFAHNDGGESASNALLRILASQEKTGITYTRGVCPPALLTKVQAKQAAARAAVSTAKEFDEKTLAAIKQSLEEHKEVMVKVEEGIQSQVVKLDGIENGMQSQVVKLDGIQEGVCNVIPDYQREITLLKAQLVHKTALCDTVEGKLAHKTRVTNQQNDYISKLEDQHKGHLLEQLAWSRQGTELENKIKILQEQLETSGNLKQMLEQARFTAEILASTLADERAAKRQRA